nr:50S ribosomal protein [Ipomoea batatas]
MKPLTMATTSLHLLIILLCFSHLICLNAIPITRSRRPVQKYQENDELIDTHIKVDMVENSWDEDNIVMRRVVAELNDYPGSGANNRHTPKPQ